MLKYIAKRVGLAIVTIWAVATITFFLMNMVPGGPFLSEKAISPQATAALEAPPMPGVAQVLRTICAGGRHNYIFTHRRVSETSAYLQKNDLDGCFREIVAPENGFAGKPAPDAVLYLMQKYHMAPAETVMVGDREIDLGSGRNAGVRTAHLVCALAPEELACDWRLHSFAQMLALL